MKKKRKPYIIYVLLIGIALLSIPQIPKLFGKDMSFSDPQEYYHIRVAENILLGKVQSDNLIYRYRGYNVTPYHYLLAILSKATGIGMASRILPFALGILALLFFYLILRNLKLDLKRIFIIMLVFVLSPAFIYLFSVSNPHSLAVLATLIGFYFFQKGDVKRLIIASIFLVIASLFSIFNMALLLIVLLSYSVYKKRENHFFFVLFVVVIIYFLYSPAVYPAYAQVEEGNIFTYSISDFGALAGISFFAVVLGIVGFVAVWKRIKKNYLYHITILLLLFSIAYIDPTVNYYFVFLVAFFAGEGFFRLLRLKWKLNLIRNLTLIIVICSLIFSTTSFLNRLSQQSESSSKAEALLWLRNREPGVVFSHYSNGFAIQTISRMSVILDGLLPLDAEEFEDARLLFESRNLENTESLLQKYNVRYIFIDSRMKKGLVWGEDDEGLLFLFQNNETFKKIHTSEDHEIWEYIGLGGNKQG